MHKVEKYMHASAENQFKFWCADGCENASRVKVRRATSRNRYTDMTRSTLPALAPIHAWPTYRILLLNPIRINPNDQGQVYMSINVLEFVTLLCARRKQREEQRVLITARACACSDNPQHVILVWMMRAHMWEFRDSRDRMPAAHTD